MEVKSTSKYVPLSPKKAREVARVIQGMPVSNALDILNFTPKKAAFLIGKTLKTAIADAENNFSLDSSSLVVKEAVIGAAPSYRRYKPRAKGAAAPIMRRNSHIFITLEAAEPEQKKKKAKKAAKKTKKAAATAEAKDA
ncbi:MAG: 50S ribosomal protein L22 [Akkermansiaceae bacterium]|nr:50S ribosomal protein L22 [Akkermansiaceae bacterium]